MLIYYVKFDGGIYENKCYRISTGNCNKIKAGIQEQTSNKVNITCSYKASTEGRGTGKLHENSPYQTNKSYSFTEGKTYTFILVS